MKKTISSIISVVILILVTSQLFAANANSTQSDQDISLTRRENQPGPRRLPLESFTASYNQETLTVTSTDYTGNVQVVIAGDDGLTYSYFVSGDHAEVIDISGMAEGSYTLTITTSGNVYTGDFEL